MSSKSKYNGHNGPRGPRAEAAASVRVAPVSAELIRAAMVVAAELDAGRAWQEPGWVGQAAAAVATVHKVPLETAKAAVLRTVALLAYCGQHTDKLRESKHLWGGKTSTIFSRGIFEVAASAPCTSQGLDAAAMARGLEGAARLQLDSLVDPT